MEILLMNAICRFCPVLYTSFQVCVFHPQYCFVTTTTTTETPASFSSGFTTLWPSHLVLKFHCLELGTCFLRASQQECVTTYLNKLRDLKSRAFFEPSYLLQVTSTERSIFPASDYYSSYCPPHIPIPSSPAKTRSPDRCLPRVQSHRMAVSKDGRYVDMVITEMIRGFFICIYIYIYSYVFIYIYSYIYIYAITTGT